MTDAELLAEIRSQARNPIVGDTSPLRDLDRLWKIAIDRGLDPGEEGKPLIRGYRFPKNGRPGLEYVERRWQPLSRKLVTF